MYLNYSEFEDMGGIANEDFFPRLEMKARMQIDRATLGRVSGMETVPQSVKYCMYDLISAIAAGGVILVRFARTSIASNSFGHSRPRE